MLKAQTVLSEASDEWVYLSASCSGAHLWHPWRSPAVGCARPSGKGGAKLSGWLAMMSVVHTAAIFACSDGGMGVDAMVLRLARRPATVREEAGGLRIGAAGGRATAASGGADDSDIVVDDEEWG